MTENITHNFIQQIPKTDLHVHLDGSLRISTLIELCNQQNLKLPAQDEEGLRKLIFKDQYNDLSDYLNGFAYTCAVMQNKDNIERIAYELAEDNIAENVRYVEVRFAPQLHIHQDLSLADTAKAITSGMERAKQQHNQSEKVKTGNDIPFEFGIILCAMRHFNENYSTYYSDLMKVMQHAEQHEIYATASLELARAAKTLAYEEGLPVVGLDLAGEEFGYPAIDHSKAYQYAHSHFIMKTVHAGEAYGPESIFQAITECYANRIGHGTFLFSEDMIQDPAIVDKKLFIDRLVDYIATQRISFEVCLTSNLQTIPILGNVTKHPIKQMLDYQLAVSICTDNRLISNTSVTKEFKLLVDNTHITHAQLRNLIISGFKGSFFPGKYKEKRAYVRRAINRYDFLEKTLLLESPK